MTEETEEDRKAMELFPDIPKRVLKNTPFPWSLDCDGDLMAADRTLVAIIPSAEDRPLLAAAPELLKHLKHMIWLVETELKEHGGHIVANAKAIVATAEGK